MNKLKRPLIAAAALTGLALIGSVMKSRPSVLQAAAGPSVTIDATQLPLPVRGSTTVSGSVAATQSGPWNVAIAGNGSTPLLVRDGDTHARTPFQTYLQTASPYSYTVPADKRLTIEYVSTLCGAPGPVLPYGFALQLGTRSGPFFVHPVPVGSDGGNGFNYSSSDLTRIYVAGGSAIALSVTPGSCLVTLSGYTEPI